MASLFTILLTAQLAAIPPATVSLGAPDLDGCAQLLLSARAGRPRPLPLPTDDLCVRDALVTELEGTGKTHLVLTVTLRSDPAQRRRLFIYELVQRRLLPRYLGSGPRHLELIGVARGAAPASDALLLEVRDRQGQRRQLRCVFEGFSLLCRDRAAAAEGTHG